MREGLMRPPTGQPELEEAPQSDTMDMAADDGQPDPYFGGGEQASPEEQAMYEKVMDAVWGLMYSEEKSTDHLVEALQNAEGNPQQVGVVAGQLGLPLMELIDERLESKGTVMNESVRLEVGEGIIEEMLELAEKSGALPDDEDSIGVAMAAAIDTMMSQYGRDMSERGMLNPEASQAMLNEVRGVAADRMGVSPDMMRPQAQEEAPAEGGGGLMQQGGPPNV